MASKGTSKQESAAQTRERVLNAARQTVLAEGAAGLTLDSVAKTAAVSKGGLLHHFKTKEALCEALLRSLQADFAALVQQHYEREPEGVGRWLRAYIRATFGDEPLPMELGSLLLNSVSQHGEILRMFQEDYAHWQQLLQSDGVPAPRATILRQAADAWWMERTFGVAPDEKAVREALMNELLSLIPTEASQHS